MQFRLTVGLGKLEEASPVFCDLEGNLRKPNVVTSGWRYVVRAKKLPKVGFHALRHTHASVLIRAGLDILTISRRLGHSKASITLDTYGHLMGGSDAAAALAIGEVLK
jgi:integrase